MYDKYDRQLRLWSASGQEALRAAHVAVLGVTVATTEVLKNIALPGIGKITIIDDSDVSEVHTQTNFFVTAQDIGAPLAKCVAKNIAELNPDVDVRALILDLKSIIEDEKAGNESLLSQFDAIVISTSAYAQALYESKSPDNQTRPSLVTVDSFGFYGVVRVFYDEHTTFESHPESLVDLRFGDDIWPEYRSYIDAAAAAMLSKTEEDYESLPYAVILEIALQSWKNDHEGAAPKTSQEKREFKAVVRSVASKQPEENREQALKAAWRISVSPLSSDLQELLENSLQNPARSMFWQLTATLREFLVSYGLPPLSGELPDMASDFKRYAQLKEIFRKKADEDYQKFVELHRMGRERNGWQEIDTATMRLFCKNSRYILAKTGKSPAVDYEAISHDLQSTTEDPSFSHFGEVFIAVTAAAQLLAQKSWKSWPVNDHSLTCLHRQVLGSGAIGTSEGLDAVLINVLRSGGGEIHSVASFVGSIAAQELLKVVMKQYVPIHHTLVYDGLKAETKTL